MQSRKTQPYSSQVGACPKNKVEVKMRIEFEAPTKKIKTHPLRETIQKWKVERDSNTIDEVWTNLSNQEEKPK